MLSFFVEESRAGEPRHPEPFSSTSLNSAPRSEWQVAGRRGRALGVRLQRRGARLRLPGRTAQPAAAAAPRGPSHLLGPPPHPGSARPPVAGSREGGRSTGWLYAGRRCCRLDSARRSCLSQGTLAGRTLTLGSTRLVASMQA